MIDKRSCDICLDLLDGFGAVIISPPTEEFKAETSHICEKCYDFYFRILLEEGEGGGYEDCQ